MGTIKFDNVCLTVDSSMATYYVMVLKAPVFSQLIRKLLQFSFSKLCNYFSKEYALTC